jgi:hypothetical protein
MAVSWLIVCVLHPSRPVGRQASKTMPDVSGFAAANGLEGKCDDEIRDAMGGTTAQKTFDQSGAPRRCLKVVEIAQSVLFNSTNIVCNRGVRRLDAKMARFIPMPER